MSKFLFTKVLLITFFCFYKAGEMPYGVTVQALNDIGLEGQSNAIVFFTEEGGKYNSIYYQFS